jgi:hypothetical protein
VGIELLARAQIEENRRRITAIKHAIKYDRGRMGRLNPDCSLKGAVGDFVGGQHSLRTGPHFERVAVSGKRALQAQMVQMVQRRNRFVMWAAFEVDGAFSAGG